MSQLRQGDVLLVKVDAVPEGAKKRRVKSKRIVLAEGEATGHSHSLAAGGVALYEHDGRRFVDLSHTNTLEHEEHSPVGMDPGTYEVVRQREYSPEEIRNVAD